MNQFESFHKLPPYSFETHYIRPAQPFMRYVQRGNIRSALWQHVIQYTERRMSNYMYTVTVVLSMQHVL